MKGIRKLFIQDILAVIIFGLPGFLQRKPEYYDLCDMVYGGLLIIFLLIWGIWGLLRRKREGKYGLLMAGLFLLFMGLPYASAWKGILYFMVRISGAMILISFYIIFRILARIAAEERGIRDGRKASWKFAGIFSLLVSAIMALAGEKLLSLFSLCSSVFLFLSSRSLKSKL